MIGLCEPRISGNEWLYIKECLDSGWVSSAGPFVTRFERELARRVGVEHAVATVNGTSALHIALLLAGVGPEQEVLVSTLSFIAPANAIRYVGAWPVFIDADPVCWQMEPGKVSHFLEAQCQWRRNGLYNRATGRRVTAILPVHILGHPVDMRPILEAAQKYRLPVIEDATESLGALYEGQGVGSLGDIGVFSFNGNKIITTGGGGMLVTKRQSWAERAAYLTTQAKDDADEYIHGEVGFNYRLTNLQAAMGMAQLEQIDSFLQAKRAIAARYEQAFRGVDGIVCMREAPNSRSIFWMYTILVERCRDLRRLLAAQGYQTRPLWQPLHLSPAHSGAFASDCSTAENLYRNALSLPCSVGLSADQQARVQELVLYHAGGEQ